MTRVRVARGRGRVARVVAAFVGATTSCTTSIEAQQQLWRREGNRAADNLGWSLSYVPDVDGDGVPDLLLGAPGAPYFGFKEDLVGKVKLYSGATRTLIREFVGDAPNDRFGASVADLGDVDGDGVRDLLVGAPVRSVPNTPLGAVFVVSGNGPTLRTFTSSSRNGQVFGGTFLEDVDGDGVRDFLYLDWDGSNWTTVVVSGATGATIRTHANVTSSGRVGDVDADGVDDYSIYDAVGNAWVASGATGGAVLTIDYATTWPAGDVDRDGHADLLVWKDWSKFHVKSGANDALLYDLDVRSGYWLAASAAGDLDGDGAPDLVATENDGFHKSDTLVHVYSGATGVEFASPSIRSMQASTIAASTDVDGDGVVDLLLGDPNAYDSNSLDYGFVEIVSGASFTTIDTILGDAVLSKLGTGATLLGDRDGDGCRDLAVVVPGGLDSRVPNVVVTLSGRDGHELGRFQTTNTIGTREQSVVSVGDVDGDGLDDVAVLRTRAVEVHSGADDSLLSTILPPSGTTLEDLAAATDVNGTPLLAVSASGSVDKVHLYDLAKNSLVATWSGGGDTEVACVGDVNGDGFVDWLVRDDSGFGAAYVFAGGKSPKKIWKHAGTSSNPVHHVGSTGDLDGDGLDDVLVGNQSDAGDTGKVTALSGLNGTKLFEIAGPQPSAKFGTHLVPLGDVNRDGVGDFVVGAPNYAAGPGVASGALYVYSGKTASPLHRFDGGDGVVDAVGVAVARTRWHDVVRVDADRTPDLVVGTSFDHGDRGSAHVRRLDDLMVQVDPPTPTVGSTVTVTTAGGPPGNLAGLYALDLSGVPLDTFLAFDFFDASGDFVVSDTAPASLQGLTLDVISYGVGFNGKLVDSQETAIEVQ